MGQWGLGQGSRESGVGTRHTDAHPTWTISGAVMQYAGPPLQSTALVDVKMDSWSRGMLVPHLYPNALGVPFWSKRGEASEVLSTEQ